MHNYKLFSAISVGVGIILIISGLAGIVFYVISFFKPSNLADKSLIFWYLPFLLFGFIFVVIGTLFTVMGFRSFKGNIAAYKTTKILLVILIAIILIFVGFAIINSFFA